MSSKRVLPKTVTLPFDKFWAWLQDHPNCILRAGTPEATLFDDDDFHWSFAVEDDGTHVVEVIKGKRLVGELALLPHDVTYVEIVPEPSDGGQPGGPDDTRFELISETTNDRVATSFFVLSHGFDDEETSTGGGGRWTH